MNKVHKVRHLVQSVVTNKLPAVITAYKITLHNMIISFKAD